MAPDLYATAQALIARGKGILAADETPKTLGRRFETLGIASTDESRRDYREMLFAAPGLSEFVSGAILQDETIRQSAADGTPLAKLLADKGIIPGIKVDRGAKALASHADETVTEGLDGLRDRLGEYRSLGARFAKWRAVFHVADGLPTRACILSNAGALARYASLCQEQGIVPIVEPEVLMEGAHGIARCEEVTGQVLHTVFSALFEAGVEPEAMLLKPNMVIAGLASPVQASVSEVAGATLRCLRRHAPAAVPGVVFLSGGQDDLLATAHLDCINRMAGPKPWTISFSYGRALQDPAMEAWRGSKENAAAGAQALLRRARCNSAAATGAYSVEMEEPLFTNSLREAPHRARAAAQIAAMSRQ
jgi:fructose-bisphosphate aldolase class I